MLCELLNRRGTGALLAAAVFLASATMASAAVYDCDLRGQTLSIIVDPADPYRAPVVGNQNGVADPSDVKFVMEPFDGGWSTPFADFIVDGDAGTLSLEGMEYECRVPLSGPVIPVNTAGALLETPGLSFGGKVRSGPGTQYQQVGSLSQGDRIKIIRSSGVHFDGYDWFEVQQGNLVGYHWGGLMCSNQPVAGILQQCSPSAATTGPASSGGGGGDVVWMAFAADEMGTLGHGKGRSRVEAEATALQNCGPNASCRVIDATQNNCHAYAQSTEGGYWYGYSSGPSTDVAQNSALQNCGNFAAVPRSCQVTYSICR